MLDEVDFAMTAGGWTGCGYVVTRSLRLGWPQDGLGSGQETYTVCLTCQEQNEWLWRSRKWAEGH